MSFSHENGIREASRSPAWGQVRDPYLVVEGSFLKYT